MKRIVVAVSLLAAAAGCSRPSAQEGVLAQDTEDAVRVEMTVPSGLPTTGSARVEIRILDAVGQPLPATAVVLEANMAHAGMRPSFASARLEQPGRWLADLELSMAGDWLVQVDARLEDGRTVRRTLPLPGVKPP